MPGLGVKSVDRIISSRRHGMLRLDDISRLTGNRRAMLPFITTPDWRPTQTDSAALPARLRKPQQLNLFA